MNSQAEKNQPPQLIQVIETLEKNQAHLAAFVNQLQRIIWLTVNSAGGAVKINEGSIPTNWRLDKMRDQETGELCLTSNVQSPPTEEQIESLVSKLQGTQIRIEEVQKELKLEEWPPQYLAFLISHRLAVIEGKWMDANIARQMAKGAGQN